MSQIMQLKLKKKDAAKKSDHYKEIEICLP